MATVAEQDAARKILTDHLPPDTTVYVVQQGLTTCRFLAVYVGCIVDLTANIAIVLDKPIALKNGGIRTTDPQTLIGALSENLHDNPLRLYYRKLF